MEFDTNMITKDGKKMMYLIAIGVNEDCEDYDAIWTELERRMYAVAPEAPIIRVDWPLYDDNKEAHDFSDCLFYAQKFEIAMGFITGIMKIHEIRSNLDLCDFYNGDAYKNNMRNYIAENPLDSAKKYIAKYHPNEIW